MLGQDNGTREAIEEQGPPTSRSERNDRRDPAQQPDIPEDTQGMLRWLCMRVYEQGGRLDNFRGEVTAEINGVSTQIKGQTDSYVRSAKIITEALSNTITAVQVLSDESKKRDAALLARLIELESSPSVRKRHKSKRTITKK